MDNTVEFKFHIQEIPNRNLVGKFVDKIKTKLDNKGMVEHKDYEIEIESDDLPIIRNEMMVGGATDSTFPYSIIEGLLDYIDNNVRVIKNENIQTDDYEKTAEKKKRIFDGLFTRGETQEGNIQNKDEKPQILPNTWDKLFIDVKKTEEPKLVDEPKPEEPKLVDEPKPEEPKLVDEPKPEEPKLVDELKPEEPKQDEKSTSSLFDRLFTSTPKPNTEKMEVEEDTNKPIDTESSNNILPLSNKQENVRPIMIEKEYIVKIQVVKDKVKSIGELGKREIMN